MRLARLSCTYSLLLVLVLGQQAFGQGMPDSVRKTIDAHLIGDLIYETTFDGKTWKNEATYTWEQGRQHLTIREVQHDPRGEIHSSGIMGWDPLTKSVVSHLFDSRGQGGTLRYTVLGDTKWTGKGTGYFEGQKWESDIAVEWTADGFRYTDLTAGKPFVVVAKRRPKAAATGMPADAQKALQKLVGAWDVVTVTEGQPAKARFDCTWSDKEKCLVWHFAGEDIGAIKSSPGMGLIAWNGSAGEVQERSFSANGNTYNASFELKSPTVWESPSHWFMESGAGFAEMKLHRTFTWKNDDEFSVVVKDVTANGQGQPGFESTFRRNKAATK